MLGVKRSSPDGSDDPDDSQTGFEEVVVKKKRLCEFEAVRLLAVAGVNDIEEKKSRVQVYKLSETLRYKNKVIAEKDREIERLRQRQITDENTSYAINRYWCNLDEQLRNILLRGSNPSDVQQLLEVNGDVSASFLEEVVQMNEEERQRAYEKRVNTSVRILSQILQNANQRAEQLKLFSQKLNDFISENGKRDEALNETVHMNTILSDENAKFAKEITRLQAKNSDVKLKLRESVDRNTILETNIEELRSEISDLKHDLNKANRLVNKLDFKLWTEIKERRKAHSSISETPTEPTTNGAPTLQLNSPVEVPTEVENGCNSKQLEELRFEAESNAELAANRLNEINELNTKLRRQAEELQRAKLTTSIPANIEDSEELRNVKTYLALMMNEVGHRQRALTMLSEEMELAREDLTQTIESMRLQGDKTIKRLQLTEQELQKELEIAKQELDTVRTEYEMAVRSIVNTNSSESKDVKTLRESYIQLVEQSKSEAARMRKKWKESVNALIKNSKELENEKKKNEKFYLLPKIVEDVTEDINDDSILHEKYKACNKENHLLRHEIERLKTMEESIRKQILETEFKQIIEEKEHEIMKLNTQIEQFKQGDESITQEMESIGQALEDLQEQNSDLIRRAQHHEEEKMKMMGDKITSSQIELKLKDELKQFELRAEHVRHQLQAVQAEKGYLDETYKTFTSAFSIRSKENIALRGAVDIFKKQTLEKAVELSQLKTDKEKLNVQVKSMQETVISKNQQHDIMIQKVRRLEEENSMMKKRLDRLKRCEKLGSTDAVMSEEIRQLKDALTCPSCKVNRKDAILTKCFHVFCMQCLKTRYDTRQRKCPKCNAGFGANEFRRAYIG